MPIYADRTVEVIGDPTHTSAIKELLKNIEQSVDQAYIYILKKPLLGVLATLDGHTQHWVRLWKIYTETGSASLLGAALGYVVESFVSKLGTPFHPKYPMGYGVTFQVDHGLTRPDIVLTFGGKEVAWVDLTSSGDAGHIYRKAGWGKTQPNYAEITYPSTDMSVIGGVAAAIGSGDFDEGLIDREIRFQRFYQHRFETILAEMGHDLKKLIEGVKKISMREVGGDLRRKKAVRDRLFNKGPFRGKLLTDQQITEIGRASCRERV